MDLSDCLTEQDLIKLLTSPTAPPAVAQSTGKLSLAQPGRQQRRNSKGADALARSRTTATNNKPFADLGAQAQQQGKDKVPNKEKEHQRIWSAYTKFIRSQCNKDRVIDSLYFGAFYKSGVDSYCLTGLGKEHVNEFKIAVNQDNVLAGPALAPEDGGKESAVVSFGAISTVAGSTPEATHSFLGRLSDLVTE